MRLKITTPEQDDAHFVSSWTSRVWLNDQEVSLYTSAVHIKVDTGGGPIIATLSMALSDLELDLPTLTKVLKAQVGPDGRLAVFDRPLQHIPPAAIQEVPEAA